jgi:rubredoxin
MCGHVFEPAEHTACASCPLQKGCQLVRCPVCGFEMVDPQQSVLARLVMNFLDHKQKQKPKKVRERNA